MKRFAPDGTTVPADRGENSGNKVLQFVGFGLSAAAFVMAIVPFLMFLIPDGVKDSSSPLVFSGIIVNAFAIALGIAGLILTWVSKYPMRAIARLSLTFTSFACIIGIAMFVLCLVFGALIPLYNFG